MTQELSKKSLYKILFVLAQMLKAPIPLLTILNHLKDEHPIIGKFKEKLIVGTPFADAGREAAAELNLSVENFPPEAISELWDAIEGIQKFYQDLNSGDAEKWRPLFAHHISELCLQYLYGVAGCMEYDLYIEFLKFLRLDPISALWLSEFKMYIRRGESVRGAVKMLAERSIFRSQALAILPAMEGNQFDNFSDAMIAHQAAQPPFPEVDLLEATDSMRDVETALRSIQPCPHVTLVRAFQSVAQDSPFASGPMADLLHVFEQTGNLGILDNATPDRMLWVMTPK